MKTNCEECVYYAYDEEYEEYVCCAPMDMDEVSLLTSRGTGECPYYRPGDEYTIVKKQN